VVTGTTVEQAEEALEVGDVANERARVVNDRKRMGREKERDGPRWIYWVVRALGRDRERKVDGPLRDLGR
jgi:hypothetical protein